ncbi:hypothetical protein H7H82_03935 [Mycobacterium heidelbergense]|uniref:hypothetical protein n=1 Tax=Mycobacterium heidelbergense TaxID=53376 RepID=UPI00114F2EC9|nr:hypothetical protein [Mycobacterium heidelbergense]MCV7049762.1 hypothetical protein [Mycobacterium heidelbergense]
MTELQVLREVSASMAAVISYESESEIVESDSDSRLHLTAREPHQKYVRIVEENGTIRLVPLDQLHESERAILLNPQLYADTRAGLQEFSRGERVSSDWLLSDE